MLGSQKPPASGFQSRLCDGSGVLGDILGKMLYLRVGRFGVPIHGGEAIRFECLFVRAFAQDDDGWIGDGGEDRSIPEINDTKERRLFAKVNAQLLAIGCAIPFI